VTLRDFILRDLEAGQASVAALAETLGKGESDVRYHVKRLMAEELVTEHVVQCPRGPVTVYRRKD
jgi:predicted ArsR family transcriptional regulator